jgi:hypothetical protein
MNIFKKPLNYKIINIFSKEECNLILSDFEKNKNHIKINKEHGVERISSYEIDSRYFSKHINDLIKQKVKEKLHPITKGKIGMVFGVRYSIDTKSHMTEHYDCNTYSCVISLNNEFKDGGTYFPFSGDLLKPSVGSGVLFKADKLNSYHSAHPITEGVRYVLVIRMEKLNSIFVFLKAICLHFIDKHIRKNKEKYYMKPKLVNLQ